MGGRFVLLLAGTWYRCWDVGVGGLGEDGLGIWKGVEEGMMVLLGVERRLCFTNKRYSWSVKIAGA